MHDELTKIDIQKMKEEIQLLDDSVNVTILPTRGLNSYYADKAGLIISY